MLLYRQYLGEYCFPVYKIVMLEGIDRKQINLTFSFMESTLGRQYKILQFMYSFLMGQRSGSNVLRGPVFQPCSNYVFPSCRRVCSYIPKNFWVILCVDTSCDLEVTLHFWSRELFGLWAIGAKNSKQLKEAVYRISRQGAGPKMKHLDKTILSYIDMISLCTKITSCWTYIFKKMITILHCMTKMHFL